MNLTRYTKVKSVIEADSFLFFPGASFPQQEYSSNGRLLFC